LNLRILVSIFSEFETVGPFELNWETEQYKCRLAQGIAFSLLASLQALNLFWLFCIMRIAYRFIAENDLDDDRSEYEESEAEELERKQAANALTEKSETTPLLMNGNGNGTPTRSNGAATTQSKRQGAR
jgi:acyl-CoA-dependent ceramide synthase